MTQTITCPLCDLHFDAEEFVDGECPECWNEFIWMNDGEEIFPLWESNGDQNDIWEITKMIS